MLLFVRWSNSRVMQGGITPIVSDTHKCRPILETIVFLPAISPKCEKEKLCKGLTRELGKEIRLLIRWRPFRAWSSEGYNRIKYLIDWIKSLASPSLSSTEPTTTKGSEKKRKTRRLCSLFFTVDLLSRRGCDRLTILWLWSWLIDQVCYRTHYWLRYFFVVISLLSFLSSWSLGIFPL